MKFRILSTHCLLAVAYAGFTFAASPVAAQDTFPTKPVRLIVPFTPGGSNDVIARVLAQKLGDMWRQPVIVDNKTGAAGNIGSDFVAKAQPDGYNLLITNNNTMSINPALLANMPFDAANDFAQVTQLGIVPVVLVVNSNVKAENVKSLIALAKVRPGALTYASSGSGSPQHLSAEMFKSMTGTRIVHIPYKGAAPAITDMLGGQIDMQFGAINSLLPHIKTGRLRALAVGGTKRAALLPEIPTMAEAGVAGYDSEIWLGLAAPAKTPRAVIQKINADVLKVLAMPDVKANLSEQGITTKGSTPEQMKELVASDYQRWAKIIKGAGIRAD
ncbi:MAG: tripartite tricarboxylate transporter substrate binding protein [Polaromonas sp.]|uniref:tripartite tricarboxylate transporter substrate binding protein n=1 Tax=Polaromonas sp. TaxID=1869339 RepID=UPI0025EC4A5D|nr:tripartite tricarboxylate transporter substrate binding protein [Polaromonas sp.]MBI2726309.1 tripartite tricarboxylate transporter substrate binding protein [Polaromonas sp.]